MEIDGHPINDVLDYQFYMAAEQVSLRLHRGPELLTCIIHKAEYEDAGLVFPSYLMDQKRTCRNRCVFCFIDQNPPGMRDTIYFKDDDSRLSFLQGNYVTMTNFTDRDIDRMITMRLTPINISVHATEPAVRCRMMGNRHAGKIMEQMRRLADAGIGMNAQIVLCRGLNDGAVLARTMEDLAALRPALRSVSVVPAGLTCHRDGLYPLSLFSPEEAAAVIAQVNAFGEHCLAEGAAGLEEDGDVFGGAPEGEASRLFFCADEFYLRAGLSLPDESYYEGYPQLDNGVGLITSLVTEFYAELPYADTYAAVLPRTLTLATGEAAGDTISSLARALEEKVPGLCVHVEKIKNTFYGSSVTVAGLVTGGDLIRQLAGKPLGSLLLLPRVMLRAEGDLFLDNVTSDEVSAALRVPVRFCSNDGAELLRAILTA